jgi:methionine synthase II (cobalamin-independent)
MKLMKSTLLALALGSPAAFAGDCSAPESPQLPDGATATMDDMLAGQQAVKAFQAANLEYMQCLEPALADAEAALKDGDDSAKETYQQIQETYNAAVSAEEAVAGQFNTEIREYKAANPG